MNAPELSSSSFSALPGFPELNGIGPVVGDDDKTNARTIVFGNHLKGSAIKVERSVRKKNK